MDYFSGPGTDPGYYTPPVSYPVVPTLAPRDTPAGLPANPVIQPHPSEAIVHAIRRAMTPTNGTLPRQPGIAAPRRTFFASPFQPVLPNPSLMVPVAARLFPTSRGLPISPRAPRLLG